MEFSGSSTAASGAWVVGGPCDVRAAARSPLVTDVTVTVLDPSAEPRLHRLTGAFLAGYRNANTRASYLQQLHRWFAWCTAHQLDPRHRAHPCRAVPALVRTAGRLDRRPAGHAARPAAMGRLGMTADAALAVQGRGPRSVRSWPRARRPRAGPHPVATARAGMTRWPGSPRPGGRGRSVRRRQGPGRGSRSNASRHLTAP
jgi:hypothetical protein